MLQKQQIYYFEIYNTIIIQICNYFYIITLLKIHFSYTPTSLSSPLMIQTQILVFNGGCCKISEWCQELLRPYKCVGCREGNECLWTKVLCNGSVFLVLAAPPTLCHIRLYLLFSLFFPSSVQTAKNTVILYYGMLLSTHTKPSIGQ